MRAKRSASSMERKKVGRTSQTSVLHTSHGYNAASDPVGVACVED